MELHVWLTYLLATIVLSLTPGPGVFSSISSGIRHGFRLGVWNGVGMQFANLFIVIGVSLGLGALLLASETLFSLVKWAGAVYLIFLGIVTWRSPPARFVEDQGDNATTVREVFMRGFWVNATNPKGMIFFAAILPQFIDVSRPQFEQYAIFAATTFVVDVILMAGYTALAARVLRVMEDTSKLRWINRGIGSAFVACGVALATFRRVASAAA
ncbi:MAG: LysE family transporter [Usitatibacter sp.]